MAHFAIRMGEADLAVSLEQAGKPARSLKGRPTLALQASSFLRGKLPYASSSASSLSAITFH
jgi:hypothetical protein